jgi:hypothetical protein
VERRTLGQKAVNGLESMGAKGNEAPDGRKLRIEPRRRYLSLVEECEGRMSAKVLDGRFRYERCCDKIGAYRGAGFHSLTDSGSQKVWIFMRWVPIPAWKDCRDCSDLSLDRNY